MPYLPIEHYGVIGDLHTVALCGVNGSIDWYCAPYFDSPSVFAALLDDTRGGRFQIAPITSSYAHKQLYHPDTNVLLTRFLTPDGVAELTDFMPVSSLLGEQAFRHRLIRQLHQVRGTLKFRVLCQPRFDYARIIPEVSALDNSVVFSSETLALRLCSSHPLQISENAAVAEVALVEGQRIDFLLERIHRDERPPARDLATDVDQALRESLQFWRSWLSQSTYRGRWREMVNRSALVLKLLTFRPTGAIVAAPTAALPELIGGPRNWDYRYTWIRDASFTLYALLHIGFEAEARQFMDWLHARCNELEPDGSLQIMYGIDGRHDLPEVNLSHLEGYKGSKPVRIGNAAASQKQLDIYGELMDAIYLFNKYGEPISYDLWVNVRRLLDWLMKHWREPDDGIWEVRGGRQQFVSSKVMCWVAFERAMRIAEHRGLPADVTAWRRERDAVYEDVMTYGWNPKRGAFTQTYGSPHLDAAVLLMPLVKFTGPTDPRIISTIEAIRRELSSGSLVYRYDPRLTPDGLEGQEGTFSMCTFWLVECMTRAGRLEEARLMFENALTYANHLGLFGEQIGPSGETLGNFPQAFTHLALISAATNLNSALGQSE